MREYRADMSGSLRVVIGEDDVLMREGIARLLEDAGHQVVGRAGDAPDLLRKALAHGPDVIVADVQMPPHRAGDGLDAAIELRRRRPETAVLILSQYYEEEYAVQLIGDRAEGVGYLLKERVADVDVFIDAVERVADGGTALDPVVIARMLGRQRRSGPLDELSPREREVLQLVRKGRANKQIARDLGISERTVKAHLTSVFARIGVADRTQAALWAERHLP
jgi:DNA-binding NarL/FixJ family response regulator